MDDLISVSAVVYRPITLSTLVQAAIMGRDRRDTRFAGHGIQNARFSPPNVYLSDPTHPLRMSQGRLLDLYELDDTRSLTFHNEGYLVPEARPVKSVFAQPVNRPALMADFSQVVDSMNESPIHLISTFEILMTALSPCNRMNSRKGVLNIICGSNFPCNAIMDAVRISGRETFRNDRIHLTDTVDPISKGNATDDPKLGRHSVSLVSIYNRFPEHYPIPPTICGRNPTSIASRIHPGQFRWTTNDKFYQNRGGG